MKVLIKNGLVIDPANNIKEKLDVLIENGIIASIKRNINEEAKYIIDAKGLIVSPGFVDLHTNFCDPGDTSKEDLKTGSLASAKGGYTHVVLGTDNKPAPSECNVIEYIRKYADIMPVNIYPSGTITIDKDGDEIVDLKFLYNHGAIGFYDGLKPIENKNLLEKAMQQIAAMDMVVSIYSEDQKDVKLRGVIDGNISKKLGFKAATPEEAECNDLRDNLALAKMTNCKIDLAYITASDSIDLVEESKNNGQVIFAEIPALNLILTDKALEKIGVNAKVLPPLRGENDRKALLKGLKKGVIDIISSNHCPVESEDKNVKLKEAISGAIGIEMVLGICGKKLVDEGILTWKEVIEKITINPAKVFNLDENGVGKLDIGKNANLTIFDPDEKWTVVEENIVSKSHNTPLLGMELMGKVKYTICNGKLVYKDVGYIKNEI